MELGQLIAESHVGDLLHCSRSQTITTRLFAWKNPLVNHDDVEALFGQPIGSGGPCGTGTNDQNVVMIVHDVMFTMSWGCRGAVVV
jgi:hypothetical protein